MSEHAADGLNSGGLSKILRAGLDGNHLSNRMGYFELPFADRAFFRFG
jgi:hypothetical protein